MNEQPNNPMCWERPKKHRKGVRQHYQPTTMQVTIAPRFINNNQDKSLALLGAFTLGFAAALLWQQKANKQPK